MRLDLLVRLGGVGMSGIQDAAAWLELQERRTGIPRGQLAAAFSGVLADDTDPDQPLDTPDRITITYKYSYGGQSRFFRSLRDDARILGTQCTGCGLVWCPPRTTCSACFCATEWLELSGRGVVAGCTIVHYGTSDHVGKVPFVCAYVKLDGADSHIWQIVEADDFAAVRPGTRVRAKFKELRCGLISDFVFVPDEAQLSVPDGGED
jgi:uncharacterized OB-fold protein